MVYSALKDLKVHILCELRWYRVILRPYIKDFFYFIGGNNMFDHIEVEKKWQKYWEENNTFKTCHDIYFVLVDAIIIFGLVNLLKNKMEEVLTK